MSASSSSFHTAASTTPKSVLDFWFGAGNFGTDAMRDQRALGPQNPMWWGMKPDFSGRITDGQRAEIDAACGLFRDVIESAAGGHLSSEDWVSDEGLFAKMLLCDQLPRNAFRGTSDAFKYDEKGVEFTRELFARKAYKKYDATSYFTFFLTPGQHSEVLGDHEMNMEVLAFIEDKFGADKCKMLRTYVVEHRDIIVRFNRYPHRNAALGRTNTDEEQAYLDDYDNLPGFAKSQMKQ